MKSFIGIFIGLVLSVSVGAESLITLISELEWPKDIALSP